MTQQVKDKLTSWAYSIELFVSEALQAQATEQQLSVLQDIDNGYRNISVKSGHGSGKSAILSWVIIWVGLFKYDAKIPITAPTAPQLTRLLLPEVKKWQKNLPLELRNSIEVLSDSIKFSSGNFAIPRTARKGASEALQGFHASYLCWIIDEASGVDDEIFEVVEGSLTGDNYLRLIMSNPTRTVGYFYNTHNKHKKLWRTHTFNTENSTNVSKDSIERKRLEYGEDSDAYRVRVKGQFPTSSTDSLFSMSEIEDAMNKKADEVDRTGSFTYACDVARYGDDSSVLSKKRGYDIYGMEQFANINTMEFANIISNKIEQESREPDGVFVDTIGLGAGTMDRLEERGYKAIDANVSMKADELNIYVNKRAEMYFLLKEFIKNGGKIPKDDELIEELLILTYSYLENGKIQLMKKSEIKLELGRSPDKGDSVALHFFSKVRQKENNFAFQNQKGEW